jgi:hypothetical protein
MEAVTELQAFQKWLDQCNFIERPTSGIGSELDPRIYSVGNADDDVIITLNPTAGHATAVTFVFENGNFHHIEGWE